MITANGIRIGNWVESTHLAKTIETKIDALDIMALSDCKTMILPKGMTIKPIPISEEFLSKLGFNECKIKNTIICSDFFLKRDLRDQSLFFVYNHEGCYLSRVRYIHQVQNLFFSLTGHELPNL